MITPTRIALIFWSIFIPHLDIIAIIQFLKKIWHPRINRVPMDRTFIQFLGLK